MSRCPLDACGAADCRKDVARILLTRVSLLRTKILHMDEIPHADDLQTCLKIRLYLPLALFLNQSHAQSNRVAYMAGHLTLHPPVQLVALRRFPLGHHHV